MKRRTLLGGLVAGGTSVALTGCVRMPQPVSAEPPARPVVPSKKQVQAIQDHYAKVNAQAWNKQDPKLQAAVEGGPLLQRSLGSMALYKEFSKRPDTVKSDWGSATGYLPAAGEYPRRCMITHLDEYDDGKPKSGTDCTVYERADAASPWLAVADVRVPVKSFPTIATQHGLARAVANDAKGYSVAPSELGEVLTGALPSAKTSQAAAFANSGELKKVWDSHAKRTKDHAKYGTLTWTYHPTALLTALATSDGGYLAIVAYSWQEDTIDTGTSYTYFFKSSDFRKKYPGHYGRITMSYRSFAALLVPKKGGKVSVLGFDDEIVGVTAEPK